MVLSSGRPLLRFSGMLRGSLKSPMPIHLKMKSSCTDESTSLFMDSSSWLNVLTLSRILEPGTAVVSDTAGSMLQIWKYGRWESAWTWDANRVKKMSAMAAVAKAASERTRLVKVYGFMGVGLALRWSADVTSRTIARIYAGGQSIATRLDSK